MSLVIRDNIKINSVPGSGTGEPILTRAAATGVVGKIGAIDTSTFVSTTLTSGRVIVGNSSNVATGVAMSGVIAISNTGVTSHVAGSIVNADVNASAGIALTKLAATTASRLLVSDGSGFITPSSVTATEVGYLSGITSSVQTQLGTKVTNSFTTNRALTSNGSGNVAVSAVTATELGYVSGVTSAIQTQLSAKHPAIQIKDEGSDVGSLGSTTVIDFVGAGVSAADVAGTVTVTIAGAANGQPSGGSAAQFLTKIDGTDYNSQWSTLTTSLITDVTASASDINLLTGLNSFGITTTELEFINGVTSNVQAQLDAKRGSTLTANYIWVGNGSNESTPLAPGSNGTVLTISGGAPVWSAPSTNGHVIQEDTTPLTDRPNLNFGAGLIASDNAGTTSTDVVLDTSFGILTTRGDILVRNASNVTARLAVGSSGYILTSDGTDVSWAAPSVAGHVIEAAGTPLTQRANLNFGNGLVATDNSPDTDVGIGGTASGDITLETDYNIQFDRYSDSGNDYTRFKLYEAAADLYFFNSNVTGTETYESLLRFGEDIVNRWSRNPGIAMLTHLGRGYDTDSSLDGFHIYGTTGGFYPAASDVILRIQPDKTVTLNLGSDARGDIYTRNSSGDFDRIAKGAEGTFFRAGADDPAWSTLTIPNTITTKSLLVANSANTLSELTLTAGQSVRLNAGGTAFEGYTPGGSGVGGSTGSTDNAILRADGTGGGTIQTSSVFIDDSGNLTLGTVSISGRRQINVESSDEAGDLIVASGGTSLLDIQNYGTWKVGNPGSTTTISPGDSNGAVSLILRGSAPVSGNSSGGAVLVNPNSGIGTGTDGNVGFMTSAVADWQDMEKGIAISNATTAPTAGIANAVAMWTEDVNSSSELYVMSESGAKVNISGLLDTIEESGTTFTLDESHRGKLVWCSNSSAVTVTVPTGLPLGFSCVIMQDNTGTVTLSTGAVTHVGKSATTAQYDAIALAHYKATDNYYGR